MLVYICGPMTAENTWEQEKNIRYAEDAFYELSRAGVAAICPHTMGRNLLGTLTHAEWMAIDLKILSRCWALLLVGDSERIAKSKGVAEELRFAASRGISVFNNTKDVIRFATEASDEH